MILLLIVNSKPAKVCPEKMQDQLGGLLVQNSSIHHPRQMQNFAIPLQPKGQIR